MFAATCCSTCVREDAARTVAAGSNQRKRYNRTHAREMPRTVQQSAQDEPTHTTPPSVARRRLPARHPCWHKILDTKHTHTHIHLSAQNPGGAKISIIPSPPPERKSLRATHTVHARTQKVGRILRMRSWAAACLHSGTIASGAPKRYETGMTCLLTFTP